MREQMPWILRGHVTAVRNSLLKRYSFEQLKDEDTWYLEVIEAPEIHFKGIHESDIVQMYEYFSPSASELSDIEEKYGNQDVFTVVIAKLIDLYEEAFQAAVKKLQIV
ncbi:hypothetical protein EHV15_35800 [Paenibacillus oralis]|uniref:Uncharacterized protein n=1 Tax=Paenibacillus oralis TaxID=2490856 RepID=A0A3P3TAA0_9BACL|nr:hypothetical protein [Paenibacillus oralis]RRJ54937.1 hypothetical protein EHV15_35800 [Paenibacillus oralis]